MIHTWLQTLSRGAAAAAALTLFAVAPASAQTEIVLHARNASAVMGDWQMVSDSTAAGGARMWNPDRGAAKLGAALASPYDYIELTFNAEAGRAYRIWLRGKADHNSWTNDSVFVQFSGAVYASGGAAYRIGTADATVMSVERCSGCGLSGWGWEDNGYGGLGTVVSFAATGPQRIRIQRREDGVSIDQIVLSAVTYASNPPGVGLNDTTILAATSSSTTSPTTPTSPTTSPSTSAAEIVIPVASAATLRGDWQQVADSTAAGGARVWNPDRGAGKLGGAAASPSDYFDVTFNAEAGRAYRLWVRGQAQNNFYGNDSVFVQFNGSLNAAGAAVWRIGTTGATVVSIEACSGCGLSGWGWEDNGYSTMGELVYFATTGPQTIRVQRREDGISIDQIVLSASRYLSAAPGATRNDTTLLTGGTTTAPAPAPARPGPGTRACSSARTSANRLAPSRRPVERASQLLAGRAVQHRHHRDLAGLLPGRRHHAQRGREVHVVGERGSAGPLQGAARSQDRAQVVHALFAGVRPLVEQRKGHVILSVFPFDSVSHSIITQSSGLNGAGAISNATITVNGRTVNILVSHLDPYDQSMRLTQARDVIRIAAGYAENRILTGDMNAWPDQSSILEFNRTYNDSWTVAANMGRATGISGISPFGATKNGRIDYIFYSRGASNLVVIDSRTPDTRNASGIMPSDHRPVVTTFDVR